MPNHRSAGGSLSLRSSGRSALTASLSCWKSKTRASADVSGAASSSSGASCVKSGSMSSLAGFAFAWTAAKASSFQLSSLQSGLKSWPEECDTRHGACGMREHAAKIHRTRVHRQVGERLSKNAKRCRIFCLLDSLLDHGRKLLCLRRTKVSGDSPAIQVRARQGCSHWQRWPMRHARRAPGSLWPPMRAGS